MPASISNQSIFALTCRFTNDGQENLNTFHYRWTNTGGTGYLLNEIVDPFITYWDGLGSPKALIYDCLPTSITNVSWFLQCVALQRTPKQEITSDGAGTVTGTKMPPNVAHTITLRGIFSGPHFRGTKHIGGVPTSFTSGGMLTPTGREAYDALAAGMADVMTFGLTDDQTFNPVIFRRSSPAMSAEVDDYIIGDTTRVMRRRTVGLGT